MRTLKSTLGALAFTIPWILHGASATLLGWNNLGMHCMDSDYSVFSILPPYNTIEAQLIIQGKLVTNGGSYTVTYQAVADPSGSFNSTAMGKGNYYSFAKSLYGAQLAPEGGLAGWAMPGTNNVPIAMAFENTNQPAPKVATPVHWFRAEGIPISPYDDARRKNPYPLMRLIARDAAQHPVATNDVVLPVSDEMDCRACHASGSQPEAQPSAGWVWSGNPERDYRLNILRLHDEHQFAAHRSLYEAALAARGFNSQGLYRGVVADGQPVLCASCHASEALGTPSYGTIPPLTASVHSWHARVKDPESNLPLDHVEHRAACYRCHPGSATKCLRGAMGGATAPDGSMAMQCQSCHGNMSTVGSSQRVGWFMEPNCQQCHTGTATSNNGQIRYTSVFTDTNGTVRVPVNATFATNPDTPAPGLSLYRFSKGHGGLQCSACHGSTHAEFPSTHANDNLRNAALQGHAGVMVECTSCHASMSVNSTSAFGGPHGMHPIGAAWVSSHHDYVEGNLARCQACHGTDNRGTVLSRAQGTRQLTASLDGGTITLSLFRGAIVGCYNCHNGPDSSTANLTPAPTAAQVSGTTVNTAPLVFTVDTSPVNAVLHIVVPPSFGSLAVSNNTLTYFPNDGFVGSDSFSYAAWNGAKNSALATGTVFVSASQATVEVVAHVPTHYPAGWDVPFAVLLTAHHTQLPATATWDFGDGTPLVQATHPTHAYKVPGQYQWRVTGTADGVNQTQTGTLTIRSPVSVSLQATPSTVSLAWPISSADTILEYTSALDGSAPWVAVTNAMTPGNDTMQVVLPKAGSGYFRTRRSW